MRTVGAPGATFQRPKTAGWRGVSHISTSIGPALCSRSATHSAARRTSAAWAGSVLTDGMPTNSASSRRYSPSLSASVFRTVSTRKALTAIPGCLPPLSPAGSANMTNGRRWPDFATRYGSRADGQERIGFVDCQRRDDEEDDAIGGADGGLQHTPFAVLHASQVLTGSHFFSHANRRIPEARMVAAQPEEPFKQRDRHRLRCTAGNHAEVAHQALETVRVPRNVLGCPNPLAA